MDGAVNQPCTELSRESCTPPLQEADAVLQRYGPLLLATGMVPVRERDLPTGPLADRWDVLSFLVLDSTADSRLAVHVDTNQLYPCLCSCDSVYPPGYYDVQGGGLLAVDGVWVEEYGRRSALLMNGHTCTHTVLPLSVTDGRKEPMLRGTIVHWSHTGRQLVDDHEELADREAELPSMYAESIGELVDQPDCVSQGGGVGFAERRRELYRNVRMAVGSEPEGRKRRWSGGSCEDQDDCSQPLSEVSLEAGGAAVGRLALELRLRGGGGDCAPKGGAVRRRSRRSRRSRNLPPQHAGI